MVPNQIDDGHWLRSMLVELSDSDIIVERSQALGQVDVSLRFAWSGVLLSIAESVALRRSPDGEAVEVGLAYDETHGVLSCSRAAQVAKATTLLGTYEDEGDDYRQEWEDDDADALYKAKMELLAQDPAELVTIMLNQPGVLSPNKMLANVTLSVTFDESGKLKEVLAK